MGGTAWDDVNGNGLQDASELGIARVRVDLFDSVDGVIGNADDRPLYTTTTAANGSYNFATAPGGAFTSYVRFEAPPGFTLTRADAGDDRRDSDVMPATGRTNPFGLARPGQTYDAGFRAAPSAGTALAVRGSSDVRATATDAAGEMFVVGSFLGTVDLDPGAGTTTLTRAGGTDAFVACYTATGILRWAYCLGGPGDDVATGVAVDAGGTVYLTGSFQGVADFDPSVRTRTFQAAGGSDVFACAINARGDLLWAANAGGAGDDTASGVAVDAAGNVVVVGDFAGAADFDPGPGTLRLTSLGPRDAFLWKLRPDGSLFWAVQADGSGGDDTAAGVTVDGDAVYVTGAFRGTADFDPGPGVLDLTGAGGRDVFVWKLTGLGGLVWARRAGGAGDDVGLSLARLGLNLFVTCSFTATTDFDPGSGLSELQSAGDRDAFVWALTAASGDLVWARRLGGPGPDVGTAVAADADGIAVVGDFQDTADFDPGSGLLLRTSAGGTDAFLARLDAAGNRQWARPLGGTGDDHARGVALDSRGVSFAGTFATTAAFDPGDGERLLSGVGPATLFVARVNQAAALAGIPADVYEPNDTPQAVTNLGVIDTHAQIANLSLSTAQDWFRFDLLTAATSGHVVAVNFSSALGSLDLFDSRNPTGTPLRSSSATPGGQAIDLAGLPPGTYFVRVGGLANPAYALTLDVPRALPPDGREANDTPEIATDLGTLSGSMTLTVLSIHATGNDDWFRFATAAEGTAASLVRIDFRHALGDLDLELYDPADTAHPIRQSAGVSDAERVSLAGLPAGTSQVEVIGFDGATQPSYRLRITAPTGASFPRDRWRGATGNDSLATASLVRSAGANTLAGVQTLVDLNLHAPADHYALVFWDHGGGLRGFNFDQSDGQPADHLTTAKVAVALAGLLHLDVIAFDACFLPAGTAGYTLYFESATRVADYRFTIHAPGPDRTGRGGTPRRRRRIGSTPRRPPSPACRWVPASRTGSASTRRRWTCRSCGNWSSRSPGPVRWRRSCGTLPGPWSAPPAAPAPSRCPTPSTAAPSRIRWW